MQTDKFSKFVTVITGISSVATIGAGWLDQSPIYRLIVFVSFLLFSVTAAVSSFCRSTVDLGVLLPDGKASTVRRPVATIKVRVGWSLVALLAAGLLGYHFYVVCCGDAELAKLSQVEVHDSKEYFGTCEPVNYYHLALKQHVSFDIWKISNVGPVVIKEIIVTVHDYQTLEYQRFPSPTAINNNIVVFTLKRKKGKLPWEFPPVAVLDNPDKPSVRSWKSKSIILNDNLPATFNIKLEAMDPGIYKCSVHIVVATEHQTQSLDLFGTHVFRFYPSSPTD